MRATDLNNGMSVPIWSQMVTGYFAALGRSKRAERWQQSTANVHCRAPYTCIQDAADGASNGAPDHARAGTGDSARERGAAIVEFALVAVVLFTIVFGLIEGGLVVRARNAVNSSADEAARRGSIAGSAQSADWQILRQLEVRGALTAARINFIVVYKAETSTESPSETCKAGTPVVDLCNIYEREDFELASGAFTCTDPNLDANWCPTDRAQDSEGFEYVGVWINATHSGLTGIFGDVDLGAQSVLPLEGSGGL